QRETTGKKEQQSASPQENPKHSKESLEKLSKQVLVVLCHNLYYKLGQVNAKLKKIHDSKLDPIKLQKKVKKLRRQVKTLGKKNYKLSNELSSLKHKYNQLVKTRAKAEIKNNKEAVQNSPGH